MKRTYIVLFELVFLTLLLSMTTAVLTANESATEAHQLALIYEETGQVASHTPIAANCVFSQAYQLYLCPEPKPTHIETRDPLAAKQAHQLLGTVGLLLVADSTNDRIMAFHAITGDLIDPNFIPTDLVNLDFPFQAIKSAAGNSILVSDFNLDLIQEYDFDGNYIGPFAPTSGVSTTILEAPRGMTLRSNGNLLVTVGAGPNIDSVVEFDPQGNYLGTFISSGSGGLDTPHDIYGRSNDWLVSKSDPNTYDGLLRYDLLGNHLGDFAQVDGTPQQIAGSNFTDTILVANFSLNQRGVLEFTADGNLIGQYNPLDLNPRGIYELPNGHLLVTMGTNPGTAGVYEIDRQTGLVDTKISGGTPRYIEYVTVPATIELIKTVGLEPGKCAATNEIDVAVGTAVTYCYHVTNSSLLTYTQHTLQDSHLGAILLDVPYDLAPGASYMVTETAVITQSTINTATWTASDSIAYTATATATATVNAFPMGITLTSTVGLSDCASDTLTVTIGTQITICYEVQNTGQFTVNQHDLVDSEFGSIITGLAVDLMPGDSTGVTTTMVVSATADHTATWTAHSPTGPTTTATDTFTINAIIPNPQFQLFLPFIRSDHTP